MNQSDKTADDGKKKPRTKQRQKTTEKMSSRKRMVFKDEKGNNHSATEVKFVLKHQDLPEMSYNSQPLHHRRDGPLPGFTAGYLPSAPFPSAADTQAGAGHEGHGPQRGGQLCQRLHEIKKIIHKIQNREDLSNSHCDPRGQISDLPTEVTDIGFGNRCGKPRGPREPPSEWT